MEAGIKINLSISLVFSNCIFSPAYIHVRNERNQLSLTLHLVGMITLEDKKKSF